MVEVDRIMVDELHVPVELMMEHAGLNLARLATRFGGLKPIEYLVVAGSGNNGGGGLAAARRLQNWNLPVTVCLPKGEDSLRSIPKEQLNRAKEAGVTINEGVPTARKSPETCVLDAYIGYGYSKRNDSMASEVFSYLAEHSNVISLDAPSGLDVTTGVAESELSPKATLTLAFPKIGLLRALEKTSGVLYVTDIGVPSSIYKDRLGIAWSSPFDLIGLSKLDRAFAEDAIQQVEISYLEVEGVHFWDVKG
ncbi:MAG: NAD(P)H-hydrate epimerase [Candidatus Thorarchaeota archaeon]